MNNKNIKIPNHIAIIMDGNGRYAKKKHIPKKLGHKKGAETLKKISNRCVEIGVKELTVYAFSTENWKRDKSEVEDLMNLLSNYLDSFKKEALDKDFRIRVIGDISKLNDTLIEKINYITEETKNKKTFTLNLAINYGGRDEIIRATNNIARDYKNGVIEEITEDIFDTYLDTKYSRDPELLIRTSNEFRLSNFLLWQSAYTEFHFTEKLWPEFTEDDLIDAIYVYNNRERRFGGR